MSTRVFVAGAIVALLWASAASAVSVSNRDGEEYKLTVIEGDASQDFVLKPSEMIEGICEKGCVIRLNDSEDDEYELEGSEVVSIEDGNLYYDEPEGSSEESGGGGSAPPEAPKQ